MTHGHSRAADLVKEALEAIERARQDGQGTAYPGLDAVARELVRMLASPVYSNSSVIGRMVTDTWPFDSPLSAVVLAATKAYEDANRPRHTKG